MLVIASNMATVHSKNKELSALTSTQVLSLTDLAETNVGVSSPDGKGKHIAEEQISIE